MIFPLVSRYTFEGMKARAEAAERALKDLQREIVALALEKKIQAQPPVDPVPAKPLPQPIQVALDEIPEPRIRARLASTARKRLGQGEGELSVLDYVRLGDGDE